MAPSQRDAFSRAVLQVDQHPGLCSLLAASTFPSPRVEFLRGFSLMLNSAGYSPGPNADVFSDFIASATAAKHKKPGQAQYQTLLSSLDAFLEARRKAQYDRKALVKHLGLSWKLQRRKEFLSSLQVVSLQQLPNAYPPKGYWWCESSAAKDRWNYQLAFGKQADERKARLPFHTIDFSRLQRIVSSGESVHIIDAKSGETVMVVLRKLCDHPDVLAWVDKQVCEIIEHKKSVRLEDPGKIVLVGYTAGAISQPAFDWARNLLSKAIPKEMISAMDFAATGVCALLWNLVLSRLPDEILDDFKNFFAETGIVHLGGDKAAASADEIENGDYSIGLGSDSTKSISFKGASLAPPMAVFALNYSRAGHTEIQPHKYAISWTTSRIGSAEKGGAFFNASYGISIQPASDTLIAWNPRHVHGTSLQDRSVGEADASFKQSGVAFVTSNRLPAGWKRYREHLVTVAAAEAELEGAVDEIFI